MWGLLFLGVCFWGSAVGGLRPGVRRGCVRGHVGPLPAACDGWPVAVGLWPLACGRWPVAVGLSRLACFSGCALGCFVGYALGVRLGVRGGWSGAGSGCRWAWHRRDAALGGSPLRRGEGVGRPLFPVAVRLGFGVRVRPPGGFGTAEMRRWGARRCGGERGAGRPVWVRGAARPPSSPSWCGSGLGCGSGHPVGLAPPGCDVGGLAIAAGRRGGPSPLCEGGPPRLCEGWAPVCVWGVGRCSG